MNRIESAQGLTIPDIFEVVRDQAHNPDSDPNILPYRITDHFGTMWVNMGDGIELHWKESPVPLTTFERIADAIKSVKDVDLKVVESERMLRKTCESDTVSESTVIPIVQLGFADTPAAGIFKSVLAGCYRLGQYTTFIDDRKVINNDRQRIV